MASSKPIVVSTAFPGPEGVAEALGVPRARMLKIVREAKKRMHELRSAPGESSPERGSGAKRKRG